MAWSPKQRKGGDDRGPLSEGTPATVQDMHRMCARRRLLGPSQDSPSQRDLPEPLALCRDTLAQIASFTGCGLRHAQNVIAYCARIAPDESDRVLQALTAAKRGGS
jgi:hypothetical protein